MLILKATNVENNFKEVTGQNNVVSRIIEAALFVP